MPFFVMAKTQAKMNLAWRGRGKYGLCLLLVAVLIVAGAFLSATPFYAPLIGASISMVAGCVIQMLSPQAKGLKGREATENAPSYAFGDAVNTTSAGNPVGIGYGKCRIDGAIISVGIYAEGIATTKRSIQTGGSNGDQNQV